ncbi:MAG: hypothetical protein P1V97_38295, partial [Planctomycetota bacterium]|nr:hypothetical protein [Planctomycetota bacterium]
MPRPILPETNDLDQLFVVLNEHYFQGAICAKIFWAKKWKGAWGKYYPKKKSIGVNSQLKTAPIWVLAHTVYHEMLHQKHPTYRDPIKGHWVRHSLEFKAEERRFPWYEASKKWKRTEGVQLTRGPKTIEKAAIEVMECYELGMLVRVTFSQESMTIVQLNPRAPRYPIIAKQPNGGLFKLRRDQVILPGESAPRSDPKALQCWNGLTVGQIVGVRSRPGRFRIVAFNSQARKYKIVLEDG